MEGIKRQVIDDKVVEDIKVSLHPLTGTAFVKESYISDAFGWEATTEETESCCSERHRDTACDTRIGDNMKTTIELDESKLQRVMELTGVKTRREAVDLALTKSELLAKIRRMEWTAEEMKNAVDPNYEVLRLREQEKGQNGSDPR